MNTEHNLKDLGNRIKKAKDEYKEATADPQKSPAGATRISIELMAGIIVGTAFGFYLDKWLDTLPIFFIIGFFLGVAAGALNIYKLAVGVKTHHIEEK